MTDPLGSRAATGGRDSARAELDREIRDRLRRFGATASVWATLVAGNHHYERHAETILPAGSYSGFLMWLELLRQVHRGTVDPDARIRVRRAERRHDAPVFRDLLDEPELTVLDCGRLMVLFDDPVAVEEVWRALAARRHQHPAAPDLLPAGGRDDHPEALTETTVRDIGVMLESAVRGTLIGPRASTATVEILRDTGSADPSLIPGNLPRGASMGRLRAEGPGVLADASVTFLDGDTLVASMCVTQDPTERSGRQLLEQLTGLLLDWARASR